MHTGNSRFLLKFFLTNFLQIFRQNFCSKFLDIFVDEKLRAPSPPRRAIGETAAQRKIFFSTFCSKNGEFSLEKHFFSKSCSFTVFEKMGLQIWQVFENSPKIEGLEAKNDQKWGKTRENFGQNFSRNFRKFSEKFFLLR